MKNSLKFIGIFALAAIIGFSMIACELDVMPVFVGENPWVFATGSQGTPRPTTHIMTTDDGTQVRVTRNDLRLTTGNIYIYSEAPPSGTTLWYVLTKDATAGTAHQTFIAAADAAIEDEAYLEATTATGTTRDLANNFFKSGYTYNFFAVITPASGDTLAAAGTTEVAPRITWSLSDPDAPSTPTAPAVPTPDTDAWTTDGTAYITWWNNLRRYVTLVKGLNLDIPEVVTWLEGAEKYISDNQTAINTYITGINAYVAAHRTVLNTYITGADRSWNKWLLNQTNTLPTVLSGTTFANIVSRSTDDATITWPTTPTWPSNPSISGTFPNPTGLTNWSTVTSMVSAATTQYFNGTAIAGTELEWIGLHTYPTTMPVARANGGSTNIYMTLVPGVAATGAQQGINRVTGQNTIVRFPGTTNPSGSITIDEAGAVGTMHIYWRGTSRVTLNAEALRSGAINQVDSFVGVGTGKLVFTGMDTAASGGLATFAPISLTAWNAGDQFITLTGITATSKLTITY